MYTKRVSGPYPLSCITCRERRKKCDRTHPTCNRCKTSGFTCLGYVSRERPDDQPETTPHHQSTRQPSELPSGSHYSRGVGLLLSNSIQSPTNRPGSSTLRSQLYHNNTSASATGPQFVASEFHLPARGPGDLAHNDNLVEWPHRTGLYTVRAPSGTRPEASGAPYCPEREEYLPRNASSDSEALGQPSRTKYCFAKTSSGQAIYPDLDSSVAVVEFISAQYQRAYQLMTVDLVFHKKNFVQNDVLAGIITSRSSCWSLFLGAKILQAMMSTQSLMCAKPYLKVLDRFGEQMSSVNPSGITMRELLGWLSAALEIFEMKLLVDYYGAHKVLRQAVPIFAQIAYADSKLWSKQGSTIGFSLHGALTTSHIGTIRFAIGDVTMATIFGLPHTVHWDATLLSNISQADRVEWWPGCPAEFIVAFAKINIWRSRHAYMHNTDECHQIERDIRVWRPYYNEGYSTESWGAIMRLATQESLRHAALIYLYMGMRGLPSSDSRVQDSCRQITQILCLVDTNLGLAPHFFYPAVVAGVCAISEKHRSIVYGVLCQIRACKVFIFQDFGFPEVMDRLWHGAGANGGEVTWDEYLASCQDVIKLGR